MKKPLTFLALAVLVAAGGLGTVNLALAHEKVNTHTVSGTIRELVVRSDSGNIRLIPGAGPVQVRETQHYVFEKPELVRDLTDGVVTIASDCGASFVRCSADLLVTVPAGVKVTLATDSGDLHVDGADIRDVSTHSDSGDVHLELAGAPRRIVTSTDSGDVHVEVPAGEYAVDADTDSGDVEVEEEILRNDRADRFIDAKTDSGDVRVQGM